MTKNIDRKEIEEKLNKILQKLSNEQLLNVYIFLESVIKDRKE